MMAMYIMELYSASRKWNNSLWINMGNCCKCIISNVVGYMFTSFIFAYNKPLFVAIYIYIYKWL